MWSLRDGKVIQHQTFDNQSAALEAAELAKSPRCGRGHADRPTLGSYLGYLSREARRLRSYGEALFHHDTVTARTLDSDRRFNALVVHAANIGNRYGFADCPNED